MGKKEKAERSGFEKKCSNGTDPKEFVKFIDLIEHEIDLDELTFVPARYDKSPNAEKSIKENIDKISISVDEARKRLERGEGNVGVYLRDQLAVMDVADVEEARKILPDGITKETLTVSSRSGKPHIYFVRGDGIEGRDYKKNGEEVVELRTGWRCVLVPGSYAYDKNDGEWGKYTVENGNKLSEITEKDLPSELKDSYLESNEDIEGPDFEGGWLNLPCVKSIRENPGDLPETGRRRKAGKILSLAAKKDGLDQEEFRKKILKNFKEEAAHGHGHRVSEYDWYSSIERKTLEWNCGEIVNYLKEFTGIPCEDCPVKDLPEAEITPSQVNASKVGMRVKLRGRVEAQKSQKALPKRTKIRCRNCGKETEMETGERLKKCLIFKGRKSTQKILAERGKQVLPPECDPEDERRTYSTVADPKEYLDYSIIWINDLLEDMAAFRGDESSTIKAVLVGEELPNSRKVAMEGRLAVDPRNEDIVLLADKIETIGTLSENVELSEEELHRFTNCRANENSTVDSLLDQIAPDLIGRDLVKESRLLTLHSPHMIPDIDGDKNTRGSLRECLFGDTKTGKSMSLKDTTKDYYKFGDYTSAETGSRAGLIYSVDTDKSALSWGTLPLNDLGYVGIDGLNKLHSEEMKEFREVLEDQRVVVRKFVSGEALARVRITACMNPPEPMNNYVTPIQAITDTYIFQKTPDIIRWDIFIPFNDSDVSKDTIIDKEVAERPLDKELFENLVYWVWSRDPEDINYSEATYAQIKDTAKEIVNEYHTSKVPIVYNGIKETITRLSVAYACLTHSSNNHETVDVEPEHVDMAKDFYLRMLDRLKVKEYKELSEEDEALSKEDLIKVIEEMEPDHAELMKVISTEGVTSSTELAEELGVTKRTIKDKYELLKDHEVIETKPGKGIALTEKGVRLIRILLGIGEGSLSTISETVKNNFTKPESQEEIVEKILEFYEEHGNPRWSVSRFLDELTESVETIEHKDLKPHVLKLKKEGKITLSDGLGKFEGGR